MGKHFITKSIVAITLFMPVFGRAQQALSLEQAIQLALQKNDLVKSSEYQVEYFRHVRKAASEIGKFNAIWMHGQYNSIAQDNNYTFTQTIPFPTLLGSQVRLGKEHVLGAEKGLQSVQNDLVYDVKTGYYQLLYLGALKSLLQAQDSLFTDFSKASSLRYKTGESNLLEMTTAETQSMEVKNQLRVVEADIQIAETHLQALLKNEGPVEASDQFVKRDLPAELDTTSLNNNPRLGYLRQQSAIGAQSKKVERNKMLPDITIGYFNQSLIGVQNVNGQDQYFGSNKHFQGFELGLAFPLWFAPVTARARAAAFNEEVLKKTADYYKTNLNSAYVQALQELDKNSASLQYYQQSALRNADLILSQARKAYRGGEIGYIEYLQSLKSVITIRSGYLQSLNQYNQSVIKMEYLLGKI